MSIKEDKTVRIQASEPTMPLQDWGEDDSISDSNQPAAPLPEWGEGGPVSDPNQPVAPLPEWGEGGPVSDSNQQRILPPNWVGGGVIGPNWNIITIPIRPITGFCTVRFLNAAENYGSFRILIGNRLINSNLSFANVTSYNNIADGFRRVTITSAASPRTVLFNSTVPFNSGEVITMAIVRSATGIDLVRIPDTMNINTPTNRGGIRMANLIFNSPPLDLFRANGQGIFSDVRYKEVTMIKQAFPREYEFYLAQTPYVIEPRTAEIEVIEDMPMAMPYNNFDPLVSFFVDVKSGILSTIYALGTWPNTIRVKTIV